MILATEGAPIGGLAAKGFNLDFGLVSDDAGQFDLFVHGRRGVHAARPLAHRVPSNDDEGLIGGKPILEKLFLGWPEVHHGN